MCGELLILADHRPLMLHRHRPPIGLPCDRSKFRHERHDRRLAERSCAFFGVSYFGGLHPVSVIEPIVRQNSLAWGDRRLTSSARFEPVDRNQHPRLRLRPVKAVSLHYSRVESTLMELTGSGALRPRGLSFRDP